MCFIDVTHSCSFNYDELLTICENIFVVLANLKDEHSKLRKKFSSLEETYKSIISELQCVKYSYEKLEIN